MVCSGMSITPEKGENGHVFRSLLAGKQGFCGACDPSITVEDILSKPLKLGVQRGTSEANAIRREQQEKGLSFRTAPV